MGRGPAWKPEEIALLGTDYDHIIAAKLGRTLASVRQKRLLSGIKPVPKVIEWTARRIDLIASLDTRTAAHVLGCTMRAVQQKKKQLGIK
jgi:hypothetical protein